MGAMKPFDYTEAELQIALCGRAIMHPCRLRILDLLSHRKNLTSGEIQRYFNLSKTAAREHVEKLKDAGFLEILYHPHYYSIRLTSSSNKWPKQFLQLLKDRSLYPTNTPEIN